MSERVTKLWPRASQPRAQRREVVDLAVEHDDRAPSGVRHRLVAAGEIDDRQPPVAEHRRAVGEEPASSGPRARIDSRIACDGIGVEPGARGVDGAGDAAHGYGLPTLAVGRTTSPP